MRRRNGGEPFRRSEPWHRYERADDSEASHASRRNRQRRRNRRRRRPVDEDSAQVLRARAGEIRQGIPTLWRRNDLRRRRRRSEDRSGRARGRLRSSGMARRANQSIGHRARRPRRDAENTTAVHRLCRRAPPLRRPAANRESDEQHLHLFLLVAHNRLQGTSSCNADRQVLSRPLRPRFRLSLRNRPPKIFNQHLPVLGTCAPIPRHCAQWRD